jgi:hypothetical protein
MNARINPGRKRWLIIGGLTAAAALIGGYAYAQSQVPEPSPLPSPRAAVRKAIKMLPGEDSIEIADAAYVMAYPDCPPKLDPDDPTHADCIAKWLELREIALEELEAPTKKKKKRPSGTSPEPEPEPTPGEPGPAEDMRQWLDSLSGHQRSELRRIVGAKYYDPIVQAAESDDDAATVSAVLRLKRSIENLVETDKVAAFKKYSELQDLLGPKLEKLLRTAKKYQN